MADAFTLKKGQLATRLRRDQELTAVARVVGLEILAWWSRKRPSSPIFGLTLKYFCETLGFSRTAVMAAMVQLEERGHFLFMRTGRADLVWPACVAPQQRSLNFGPQRGEKRDDRGQVSGPPINQNKENNRRGPGGAAARVYSFLRQPGDNDREREVLEALGPGGPDILSVLNGIDNGRPYEELIVAAREGRLSELMLAEARERAASLPKAVGA